MASVRVHGEIAIRQIKTLFYNIAISSVAKVDITLQI